MDSSSLTVLDSPSKSSSTSRASSLPSSPALRSLVSAELRLLESQLRCGVCLDLFKDPVISTGACAHTFCSVCVRKYLLYKQQCPECYAALRENELRPNRIAAEVLTVLVQGLLPKVCRALEKIRAGENVNKNPENSTAAAEVPEKNSWKDDRLAVDASPCPVCGVSVPQGNANKHLDRCLQEQAGTVNLVKPRPLKSSRKPVQKLVYHLLKESELRKRLKEKGLDAKGDKRTLIARHQRFAALWNSQCDLENPMSPMEIVMQVQKEEQTERREQVSAASARSQLLTYDRYSDPEVIEQRSRAYMRENKSQFSALIAQARENMKKKSEEGEQKKVVVVVDGSVDNNRDDDDNDNAADESLDARIERRMAEALDASSVDLFTSPAGGPSDSSPSSSSSRQPETPRHGKDEQSSKLYATPKRTRLMEEKSDRKKLKLQGDIMSVITTSSQRRVRHSACPVCQRSVPNVHINEHLDRCLEKAEKRQVIASDSEDDFLDGDRGMKSSQESTTVQVVVEPDICSLAEDDVTERLRKKDKIAMRNGKRVPTKSSNRLATLETKR